MEGIKGLYGREDRDRMDIDGKHRKTIGPPVLSNTIQKMTCISGIWKIDY